MPKNIAPQDQWETQFEVPLPGEPRNIGPLETLFQRLLNRTERLRSRIGDLLGLPWDSTPPDTLAGLHQRVGTLEAAQGGTTLQAHRSASVLDHPDGSVTLPKLGAGLGYGSNAFVDPNAYYNQTGQNYPLQIGEVALFVATGNNYPLRIAVSPGQIYEVLVSAQGEFSGILTLLPNGITYDQEFREASAMFRDDGTSANYSGINRSFFNIVGGHRSAAYVVIDIGNKSTFRISAEIYGNPPLAFTFSAIRWTGTAAWTWLGVLSSTTTTHNLNHVIYIRRLA